MSPEYFVNLVVTRGITCGVKPRAAAISALDDQFVISPRLVNGRPHRRTQNRSAVHALRFQRRLSLDQQLDGLQLPTIRSPVKAVNPVPSPAKDDALVQQEFRDASSTQKTSTRQCLSSACGSSAKYPFSYHRTMSDRIAAQKPALRTAAQAAKSRRGQALEPPRQRPKSRSLRTQDCSWSLSVPEFSRDFWFSRTPAQIPEVRISQNSR